MQTNVICQTSFYNILNRLGDNPKPVKTFKILSNTLMLYLFHDLFYCRCVWCVQQFSNKERFDSSPHNARQGVGLQTLDQTFTERSCKAGKKRPSGRNV